MGLISYRPHLPATFNRPHFSPEPPAFPSRMLMLLFLSWLPAVLPTWGLALVLVFTTLAILLALRLCGTYGYR